MAVVWGTLRRPWTAHARDRGAIDIAGAPEGSHRDRRALAHRVQRGHGQDVGETGEQAGTSQDRRRPSRRGASRSRHHRGGARRRRSGDAGRAVGIEVQPDDYSAIVRRIRSDNDRRGTLYEVSGQLGVDRCRDRTAGEGEDERDSQSRRSSRATSSSGISKRKVAAGIGIGVVILAASGVAFWPCVGTGPAGPRRNLGPRHGLPGRATAPADPPPPPRRIPRAVPTPSNASGG